MGGQRRDLLDLAVAISVDLVGARGQCLVGESRREFTCKLILLLHSKMEVMMCTTHNASTRSTPISSLLLYVNDQFGLL